MNILYINQYAGSPEYGMEYRPYHLAKQWQNDGHKVKILAGAYSHVRAKQPEFSQDEANNQQSENIDGIEYIWYKTPKYDGNGLGRVKNIFTFLWRIWRDRKNLIEFAPNSVIASSTQPLDIFIAKYLAKKAKAKLIFEIHDLWPLSPIELGGMSPKHPFIMLLQFAENYAYKNSDKVVSILPNVAEHTKSHGLDLSKLVVVPNGIVEEDWQADKIKPLSASPLLDFLQEQKQLGKIIVGYAGAHGTPNALEFLLDAAKILQDNKNIVFVLVGSGLEKQNLQKKQNDENIKNVYFFDPIPKTQIPSLLNFLDIAYIGWLLKPIYRFGVSPNKLMDYMMAERAILHSIDAGNDLVEEAKAGLSVKDCENPNAIAQAILRLAQTSAEDRQEMGKKGKAFVLKNHTYKVLAEKFLQAMQ